eukprot:909346-Rhodomonas_salina.1
MRVHACACVCIRRCFPLEHQVLPSPGPSPWTQLKQNKTNARLSPKIKALATQFFQARRRGCAALAVDTTHQQKQSKETVLVLLAGREEAAGAWGVVGGPQGVDGAVPERVVDPERRDTLAPRDRQVPGRRPEHVLDLLPDLPATGPSQLQENRSDGCAAWSQGAEHVVDAAAQCDAASSEE